MEFARKEYLDRLESMRGNGFIKVITGLRRVGKSYLMLNLFYRQLIAGGMNPESIITIELDDLENDELLDPKKLYLHIKSKIRDTGPHVVLLDEIQAVPNFESVLNSLLHIPGTDIYVTGSNSRFLSKDIITEFRGRSREIRVHPLSYSEFYDVYEGPEGRAWSEYYTFGGMPQVVLEKDLREKASILKELYSLVYLKDIVARYEIRDFSDFDEIISVLASAEGSLVNFTKLTNTFSTVKKSKISPLTIERYVDFLKDAFLINEATRYDIKGKRHIGALRKYYFEDPGLRNARLSFTQIEPNHLMEGIIFTELLRRGLTVNIGVVGQNYTAENGSRAKKQLEVDFMATDFSDRVYIQSVLTNSDEHKLQQELRPLSLIGDAFRKIVVTGDQILPHRNEDGVLFINVEDFLRDPNSLKL